MFFKTDSFVGRYCACNPVKPRQLKNPKKINRDKSLDFMHFFTQDNLFTAARVVKNNHLHKENDTISA
jgi:hypothetical protein